MKKNIYYNGRDLYFQFDNFTPIDEDDCGLYFLSSNTVMLCLSFLQHYGKWRNRYTYDLSVEEKQRLSESDFDLITEIVDKAIKELMTDACKSLQEIEFTLKHMLTVFSRDKKVFWEIEKPPEPTVATGPTYISKSRYDSSFDYNVILDPGNPTSTGSNQLWGMGDLMAKAFLDYQNSAHAPHAPSPIVVESLLKFTSGKSLEEIEYTLKTLLTMLGKDKEIKIYIDKPVAATAGDNETLEVNRESVFEIGSVLETNNITEIFKIALLDDGTIQLPDLNPFNLESKIDGIRTDINLSQVHFTGSFTDIVTWFGSAFYESPYSIVNPFATNSVYGMLLSSFNKTAYSTKAITIPFWGTINVPYWTSQGSYFQEKNTLYEMANFQGVAQFGNSYAYSFYVWTHGTFTTLVTAMKDCICAIPGAVKGLSLSPIINVAPANPLITVEGGDVINVMPANPTITVSPTPITNNINVSPTPVSIINNVDACCDDGTQPPVVTPPETSYPPIDPTKPVGPDNPTTEPYNPTTPKPLLPTIIELQSNVSARNAICGFNYYVIGKFIEWVDFLFDYLNPLNYLFGKNGVGFIIEGMRLTFGTTDMGGVWLSKIPTTVLRTSIISVFAVIDVLDSTEIIQEHLEIIRNELGCAITGNNTDLDMPLDGTYYRNYYTNSLLNLGTIDNPIVINSMGYLIGVFADYGLYNPAIEAVSMEDYAQYCPCPEDVPTGCNTNALLPLPLIAPYNTYEFVSSPFATNETDNIVMDFVWSPEYPVITNELHTVTFEFDTLYNYGIPALPSDVMGVFDVFILAQYQHITNPGVWYNVSAKYPFDESFGGITLPPEYSDPYTPPNYGAPVRLGQCTWEVANGKLKVCVSVKGKLSGHGATVDLSQSLVRFTAQPRVYIGNPSPPDPVTPLSLTDNGDGTVTADFSGVEVPAGATTTMTVNGQSVTVPSGTSYTTPAMSGEVTVELSVQTVNQDGSVTTTVYTQVITVVAPAPCVNPPSISAPYYEINYGTNVYLEWVAQNATITRLYMANNGPKTLVQEFGNGNGWKTVQLEENSTAEFTIEAIPDDVNCDIVSQVFSVTVGIYTPCGVNNILPEILSFSHTREPLTGNITLNWDIIEVWYCELYRNGTLIATQYVGNQSYTDTVAIPSTTTYRLKAISETNVPYCFVEMELVVNVSIQAFADITTNLGGVGSYRLPLGSRTLLHEAWVRGLYINWPANITVTTADNGVGNEEGDYPLMAVPNPRITELNVANYRLFIDDISQYGDIYQMFELDTVIVPNIFDYNNGVSYAPGLFIGKYDGVLAIKFSYMVTTPVITGSGTFNILANGGTTGDSWLVMIPERGLELAATPSQTRSDALGLYRYGELPQITTHIAGYRRLANATLYANGYYFSFMVRCPSGLRPCSAKLAAIRVDVISGENTNVGIYPLTANRYIALNNDMTLSANAEIVVISGYLSLADYNAINALPQVNFVTLCEVGFVA
jgi:hypothetical protein